MYISIFVDVQLYNYSTFAGKHQALFKVLDFDTSQEVAALESPNRNPAIPVTKLHSASDHVNPSRFNSWMTQGSIRVEIFVIPSGKSTVHGFTAM